MSTYYDYREVGVMIAHKLMTMEGWKVYGYRADESDSMTDYYSPAYWNGVAEKNGYVLCVNVYRAEEEQEIKVYNKNNVPSDVAVKVQKLKTITVERGATIHEEQTAKDKIETLLSKQNDVLNDYTIVGRIPAHQAHPSKCNWHIEKDGIIIAKGNGILKYARVDNYFNYDRTKEEYDSFKKSPETWADKWVDDVVSRNYYTEEKAREIVKTKMEDMQSDLKLIEGFNKLITKFDTTCGGMLGDGEIEQYEKVIVTEYKKENKVVECAGSVKEGQCFILKTGFNYGRNKGLVYRIHEYNVDGYEYKRAYKLNGKLTKECTGRANSNNSWSTFGDKFDKWIETEAIAFCNIEEVKVPYEVEKFVKKTSNTSKSKTESKQGSKPSAEPKEKVEIKSDYTYIVKEDVHTKDNSTIFTVKVEEKLDREEYKTLAAKMKSLGGYYSKFKHAFIFKENPSEKLGLATEYKQEEQEQETTVKDIPEEIISINFNKHISTIEIKVENATEETMTLLKQNGYTWLSFAKAYVKEDSQTNRKFIQEHFEKWLGGVA